MLKKDLYAIAYVLTAIIVAGSVAYYIFFVQKDLIDNFNDDPVTVRVAADQTAMGQQIVKAALGMGYSNTERNLRFSKLNWGEYYPSGEEGMKH